MKSELEILETLIVLFMMPHRMYNEQEGALLIACLSSSVGLFVSRSMGRKAV